MTGESFYPGSHSIRGVILFGESFYPGSHSIRGVILSSDNGAARAFPVHLKDKSLTKQINRYFTRLSSSASGYE